MEKHFSTHKYFVAYRYFIADIALDAYSHVAHECDFYLTVYPAVRDWLARIESVPGHISMDWEFMAMAAE